ncbi:MAG: PAS domain-containing protein [Verrucomicrobiota bacterium]
MQATNEELVASNEELQSTNEELHSVNEEIHTVNAELRRKIDELTELSTDMETLLATTEVGVLFLDTRLKIRRFTPKMAEIFNLINGDEGRSIEHFAHHLEDQDFIDEAHRALSSGDPVERKIRDDRGTTLLLRVIPYYTLQEVCGVVLVLLDISESEKHEIEKQFTRIANSAVVAIVGVNNDLKINSWNPRAESLFGFTREEAIGRSIRETISPSLTDNQIADFWSSNEEQSVRIQDQRTHKSGEIMNVEITFSPIFREDGTRDGVSAIIFAEDAEIVTDN